MARFPWRYSMIFARSRRVLTSSLEMRVVGGETMNLSTIRTCATRGSAGKEGTMCCMMDGKTRSRPP